MTLLLHHINIMIPAVTLIFYQSFKQNFGRLAYLIELNKLFIFNLHDDSRRESERYEIGSTHSLMPHNYSSSAAPMAPKKTNTHGLATHTSCHHYLIPLQLLLPTLLICFFPIDLLGFAFFLALTFSTKLYFLTFLFSPSNHHNSTLQN